MPLPLDFTQRVVNVKWTAGVIFIVAISSVVVLGGAFGTAVYYIQFENEKTKPNWKQVTLPNISPTTIKRITGSCYAAIDVDKPPGNRGKSTFTLAGYTDIPGSGNSPAFVFTSNDGTDWRKTFESTVESEIGGGGGTIYYDKMVQAIVWEPEKKAFYFNLFVDTKHTEIDQNKEQYFSSSNGETWSMISENVVHDIPLGSDANYISTFPALYCAHNNCTDRIGQHVPDGIMHSDTTGHIMMRPRNAPTVFYDSAGFIEYDKSGWSSNVVEIFPKGSEIAEKFTATIPGIETVTCVAGVGNIWMAGGIANSNKGATAISFDRGETWDTLQQFAQPVTSITAAPSSP